jgi:hypothetical protein
LWLSSTSFCGIAFLRPEAAISRRPIDFVNAYVVLIDGLE